MVRKCVKWKWLEFSSFCLPILLSGCSDLSQSSVNPPTGNTRPTDGSFDQSVVSDRPSVRQSGCSQFHASPLLCCGASQTKVKKWLWGAGVALTIRGIIEQYRLLFDLEISQSDHQCLENQVVFSFNFKKKLQLYRSKYHRELKFEWIAGLGKV